MLELAFQKKVISYLHNRRIWTWRTQMGFDSGFPDLICIYKGYFIGLELKRPDNKGRHSKQQEKVKQDLLNAGAYCEFITSIEQVERILKTIDEKEKRK